MLTKTDLPTFLLSDTDVHVSKTGVWAYAGSSPGSWTIPPATPSPRATDSQTYFIKVRATAGPLTINRSNADFFAYGAAPVVSITLQPGQSVMLTPGGPNMWDVSFLSPTVVTPLVTTSATTLALDRGAVLHVYSGGAASTWTLPALANNTGLTYRIKNRGAGTVTLQRAGTDQLYDTAAVNSISVGPGASATVINDGTYWLVL